MRRPRLPILLVLFALLVACGGHPAPAKTDPRTLDWAGIEQTAHGQSVKLTMWLGDPAINAYMRDFVTPRLKRRYGITLHLLPGEGGELVSNVMTQIEAGSASSATDMVWINGQVFYQLRQIHALFGPFTGHLPNNRYVDWSNPFIANDFQQPVNGHECPWGNVQLLLITDTARVPQPPRTPQALAAWIHAHPGRFTFDTSFTGMSFLKSLMYAFVDSPQDLAGPFNPVVYARLKGRVFDWVRGVQPDLWHHGSSFPAQIAQLHQLFANGEVDFSMSFNDGEVDNKIDTGLFPQTAKAFALTTGMLQNSHYIGILAHSPHKAAAMVVANFLISPEAQLQKLKPQVWGDGTVLNVASLPAPWPQRFAALARRSHAPPRSAIQPLARREPAPEVMIHLAEDFRREILAHGNAAH